MKQSQLVIVPSPGIGHLVSTVEFAKLLINHDHRLFITVFIIKRQSDTTINAYTDSLASALNFPKTLQLIHLPNSESHPTSNFLSFIENQIPRVREAVSKLVDESNSTPDSPRLAGFIVDMFCTVMIDVANEFGVPAMVFYTSGAGCLGLFLHLHTLRERDNLDTTASNFRDSGTELAIPCFVNPVPANVFPAVAVEKEQREILINYVTGLKKAKVFIVNTFEELESHAVHSISNGDITVYPVGPLLNPKSNTETQGSEVFDWLDNQPPSSVIFLCFGSKGCFKNEDQVREIARALENSGFRFLWSLRKPSPNSPMESPSDYSDLSEVLPEGFLERTAGIGRVIGWAPQTQILAHQAIGGFVSHCGWNSILESIYFGVPIATWPLYAEQQLNAFQLVRDLKMAVEMALDYNIEFGSKTVLSAERIEKGIKDLMKEESEIRKKVKEISETSREALLEGGSSYSALSRFIDDITNMV